MTDGSSLAERTLVTPYSRYASVYDRIGQRSFGERMAESVLGWLHDHERSPHRVADLACGTGAATLVFAATGMDVTGVDRSPEMLTEASRAATAARLPIRFLGQDLVELDLGQPVELVTCFYDSLNYIVDEHDLATIFARIAGSLVEGGLLFFDLNTRRKLAEVWGDSCVIAVDDADLFGIYRSTYDPRTGLSPLVLSFFSRIDSSPEAAWERFDEEHVERGYPIAEIVDMLEQADLAVVDVRAVGERCRLGGTGSEDDFRVLFIAELRQKAPNSDGG